MIDPLGAANSSDAALALATLPDDLRVQRDADAVAYLTRTGNADLIDMLGLAGSANAADSPLSRACPRCGAVAGTRCVKVDQVGTTRRFHRARYRVVGGERS